MRRLSMIGCVVVAALSFAAADESADVVFMKDAELFARLRAGEVVQLAECYASQEGREIAPENRLAFGFPHLAERCVRSAEATPEDMETLICLAEKRTPVLERAVVNSLRRRISFQEAPVAERAIAEGKWEVVSGLARHFVAFGKPDVERVFREGGPEKGFRFAKAVGVEEAFVDFFAGDAERFHELIEAAKQNREIVDAICLRYQVSRRGGIEEWQMRDLWGALLETHPEIFGEMARLGLLSVNLWTLESLARHGDGSAFATVVEVSEPARKKVAEVIVENPQSPQGKLFLERVPEEVRAEVLPKETILKVALKQGGERLEALRQAGWVSEADFKAADDARYEAWVKQRFGNYSDASDWFEPHGDAESDLAQVKELWPERVADFQARRKAAGLAWLRKHGPYTYDNIMWELQRDAIAIAEAKLTVIPRETPCPADVLARLILKAPESALIPALIARCADLNAAEGVTPLIAAVGVGEPELIKALVAHGANPNQKVRAGAVGHGLLGGGLPGVDAGVGGLLAMGVEARFSGMDLSNEETMEIYLREGGWRHLASTAAGLVADALTSRGPTALEQAACVKKSGLIEAFLESGVTIDRKAAVNTPLAYACAMGNADAIRALLKAGCNANCFVSLGKGRSGTALSYATLTVEDQALVRQLAEAGAGVSDAAVYRARMKGWDALADWLKTKVDPHYYSDYGIAAKAMKKELLLGEEKALHLLRNLRVTGDDATEGF